MDIKENASKNPGSKLTIQPLRLDTSRKIELVPTDNLKPFHGNPRTHTPVQEQTLTEGVLKFGRLIPLLVNNAPGRENIIIGGNFRWEIYKKLGIKMVEVIYINEPDLKRERELNLRLNQNQADFNWNALKEAYTIDELLSAGFGEVDLERYWDNELGVEDDHFNIDKTLEEVKKNPITKPGDLWKLGNHKIICGSCTDPTVVKRLASDIKVSYINSDPPFNLKLNYAKGVGGKSNYGGQEKDTRSEKEYLQFLKSSLENALAVAVPDAHIFYWSDEANVWLVQGLYKALGIDNKRLCIWIKNNQSVTPNVAFNKMTEYSVYGTRGKPWFNNKLKNLNEIQNKEVSSGNRSADDIMDLLNLWLVDRLPSSEYQHPTTKPPQLYEKAMRRCTRVGDYILDSFGGSGSQLIAAEQLKRRALVIEVDPVFVDLTLFRYEQLTGIKPQKLS